MTRRFANNHDVLLAYQKTNEAFWDPSSIFLPYDADDLDEKTDKKYSFRDPDGRRYTLGDLTNPNPNRPNLTYEFLGHHKVWRWTKDRMKAAHDAGIVVQPSTGAVPRVKRYLDEREGKPLDDVWVNIAPLNSQAKERLGFPTQKPVDCDYLVPPGQKPIPRMRTKKTSAPPGTTEMGWESAALWALT